jgi:hypothetical protein
MKEKWRHAQNSLLPRGDYRNKAKNPEKVFLLQLHNFCRLETKKGRRAAQKPRLFVSASSL